MAGTVKIIYYDRQGHVIKEQHTTDEWSEFGRAKWNAWLKSPHVELACAFATYELVEDLNQT